MLKLTCTEQFALAMRQVCRYAAVSRAAAKSHRVTMGGGHEDWLACVVTLLPVGHSCHITCLSAVYHHEVAVQILQQLVQQGCRAYRAVGQMSSEQAVKGVVRGE